MSCRPRSSRGAGSYSLWQSFSRSHGVLVHSTAFAARPKKPAVGVCRGPVDCNP
jgi:hypothetical protein